MCFVIFALIFWIYYRLKKDFREDDLNEKKDELKERKENLELIKGKNKLKKEKDSIEKEEKAIENEEEKIKTYEIICWAINYLIVAISFIVFVISLIMYAISIFKVEKINSILSDIEVVSYTDVENNVSVTGEYYARITKRKVYFDLKVEVRNLNLKDISYARIIENNSKEKFDLTNFKSGETYSKILVDNVNENTEYDIDINNIVFDE